MRRQVISPLLVCLALLVAPRCAPAATITGSVIGEGARPVAGATVEVVQDAAPAPCRTTAAADGTFSLACAARGRHVLRASFGDLRPWEIADVDLAPGRTVHLNFMLLPAASVSAQHAPPPAAPAVGFFSRRVPNPVLGTWRETAITLRMAAIAVAPIAFIAGGLTMLALGRRFGIASRPLSSGEVGDMVLNPNLPSAGERVAPIAVVGARGAEARISYGTNHIAAALAAGRYGLVFVSLGVAPALFALSTAAFAIALTVGQEAYVLCALLLVPAGFVLTSIMIGIQTWARQRR